MSSILRLYWLIYFYIGLYWFISHFFELGKTAFYFIVPTLRRGNHHKNGCAVGTPFASIPQFSTNPQFGTCATKVIERLKKVIDGRFIV